ncbi:MAG TPA: gluconokinase [Usitatibacter sp.]|jgi:gluconokinase|nr:gluconokinase [Usitatibacter sp.]
MIPAVIVVMGVSGSGKTTVAEALARRLRYDFAEGDAFHPEGNVAKMRAGIPLDDLDREPWLDAIAAWIAQVRDSGRRCVVACSALKRAYRRRLAAGHDDVRFVYLQGDYDLIAARLARRRGHYMPLALLRSQFDALEEPGREENPLVVPIDAPPDKIVATITTMLDTVSG